MKKILYIHHGKGIGGAAISLLQMLKKLDTTKFKPTLLFMQQSEAVDFFKKELKGKGVEIIKPINYADFSHTKIWWLKWYQIGHQLKAWLDSALIYFFKAGQIFNKVQPDIVHLNTTSLFPWAAVAKTKNIKVLCHVREPLAEGYFGWRKNFVTKMVSKYSDQILAISKNDALPWKDLKKCKVLYNAADPETFYPKITYSTAKLDKEKTKPKLKKQSETVGRIE